MHNEKVERLIELITHLIRYDLFLFCNIRLSFECQGVKAHSTLVTLFLQHFSATFVRDF